ELARGRCLPLERCLSVLGRHARPAKGRGQLRSVANRERKMPRYRAERDVGQLRLGDVGDDARRLAGEGKAVEARGAGDRHVDVLHARQIAVIVDAAGVHLEAPGELDADVERELAGTWL